MALHSSDEPALDQLATHFSSSMPPRTPVRSLSVGDFPLQEAKVAAAPASGVHEVDPWTAWAYQPHSILALLCGASFLVYWSGALQPEPPSGSADFVSHVKEGILAMVAVFLGYSFMQAPPTILIRPHPAFWRIIHGVAVLYLVFLTFILFQTRDDAQQFLRFLHPELGKELIERSYGTDCRIYTPELDNKFKNVYDTIFDEFVIAHTLGWFCKAIMYRNNLLLWILSVGFEFMEVTFHHMLPNFNECWWDSIILDVLLCNWIGIWVGMKAVRYFDGKTYNWVGISQQPSLLRKLKRSLSQFTPATWDTDQWNMFSGPKRFVQVLGLIVITLAVELNAFFLKFCLWIPPTNPLNTYRLIIWFFIGQPAIREYNHFLQTSEPMKKLGAFSWLSLAVCVMEVLIAVKFGRGLYPNPMPQWLVWFWVSVIIGIPLFLGAWISRQYSMGLRSKISSKKLN